jgi:hypothetical protein
MSALFVMSAPPSPNVPRFFWMMKLTDTASLPDQNGCRRRRWLGVVFDHVELVRVGDL